MRYIRTICIIVMIVAVNTSCSISTQEKTQLPKEFKLSIVNNPTLSDWSDYIADIEFIPLETTSEATIGDLQKIIFRNGRIYIKCLKNEGIFIFNKEGRFIKHICLPGKAPFQVTHLVDFSIAENGNIYALDKGKLMAFDKDGNPLSETFIKPDEKKLGIELSICVHNVDTVYLWHHSTGLGSNFHLSRRDINGVVNQVYVPYTHYSLANKGFVQCGRSEWTMTMPLLNDTVRVIENGKLKEKYVLKIAENDKNIPPLISESPIDFSTRDKLFEYVAKHGLTLVISDVVMNSDYLIATLYNLSKPVSKRCMINVKTGSVSYFDQQTEFDNLFFPKTLYLSENDKFLSSINAYQVTDLLSRNKTECSFLPEKRRLKLIDKLKTVKDGDNPVLMMITIKE